MTPERRQLLTETLDDLHTLANTIQDILNGNLSQTQAANQLGITPQSMSHEITNHFLPRLHRIPGLSTENILQLLNDCETPYEALVKDILGIHDCMHPHSIFLIPDDTEDILKTLLDKYLTDYQKEILTLKYGLDGNKPMSLKEIGDIKSLSRERIRQIAAKSLRALRRPNVWHQLLRNYPMYIKGIEDLDTFKTINESYLNRYNESMEEYKHLQKNVHFVKAMDEILKEHQLTYLTEPLSSYIEHGLSTEEVNLLHDYSIDTIGDLLTINQHVYLTCYAQMDSLQTIYHRLHLPVPESIKLLQEHIDVLDLSIRTYNCLKRKRIMYISDLIICTKEEIQCLPALGTKSFDELCQKMKTNGLQFRQS